jgi:hypothetical protein
MSENKVLTFFSVFIYSVPPSQSCTIKELMLFSSCKAPLLAELQGTTSPSLGIQIDKKVRKNMGNLK